MKKVRTDSRGIALVEAVLLVVIISLVFGTGFWVVTQRKAKPQEVVSSSQPNEQPKNTDAKTLDGFDKVTQETITSEDTVSEASITEVSNSAVSDAAAASSVGDYNESF